MKRLVDLLIVVFVLLIAGVAYLFLLSDKGEELGILPAKDTPAPTVDPVLLANLPVMTNDELRALLPASAKLNTVFGAEVEPVIDDATMSSQVPELRDFWPDAARRLETIITRYGWDLAPASTYDFCQLTAYPIGQVTLGVSQLSSPALARQFIDDSQVLGLMVMGGKTHSASDTLHGWNLESEASEGSCYDSEVTHSLVFEYWGMILSVDIAAQEGVTRAELQPLFDQLAAIMTTRVNVLEAAANLPATPIPAVGVIEPEAIPFPLTLEFLEEAVPADEVFSEDMALFLNHNVSRTYTLDEYVATLRQLNMTALADSLNQVGKRAGMVGQVVRVWDSQGTCPDSMLLGVEMDFALFDTAQGTLDYLNNQSLQMAWIETGSVKDFAPEDTDTVFVIGGYTHTCGEVEVTELRQAYGRVLVAISFTHHPDADAVEVRAMLSEAVAGFESVFAMAR